MPDQSYTDWRKEHSLEEYRDEVWSEWREIYTRKFDPVPSMERIESMPADMRMRWLQKFDDMRCRAWLRATGQWTPEQEREVEQDIMGHARRRDISDDEHIRRDDESVEREERK